MINLDSVLKSRDITLPTKVDLFNAMLFPVVMYGCESWTLKKAKQKKNLCFWTVVLEKTLVSPLDSKEIQPVYPKGNQSWIFTGWTDAEADTPILWWPDVKNCFTRKYSWFWLRLKAGGEGDNRRWDVWVASPTWWTWVWASSESWWWTAKPGMLQSMGSTDSQTWLSYWTELMLYSV